MKTKSIAYSFLTGLLRAALVIALLFAGWLVYRNLPHEDAAGWQAPNIQTTLQIVLRPESDTRIDALDIQVELYPVDLVAVRHEYFTERRPGKRFDDFLSERMKGRTPVAAKLDKQGRTSVLVNAGNWWLHAQLAGEENLEWRLPVEVAGQQQTIELTSQNVYTRTRSF